MEEQNCGGKMDYGDLFFRALMEAIPKVPEVYFKCSNANREEAGRCFHNPQNSPVKKAAFTHGERAFCYELYHQLRISLNTLQKFAPGYEKLVLHGELQKKVLLPMTEKHTGLRRLNKEYIPDFLLHVPDTSDKQEVVMEVKTTPKLQFNHMFADLKKIDEFISKYHYKMGIFLAININGAVLFKKLRKYQTRLQNIEKLSQIHVIASEGPDKEVYRVPLLMFSSNPPPFFSDAMNGRD